MTNDEIIVSFKSGRRWSIKIGFASAFCTETSICLNERVLAYRNEDAPSAFESALEQMIGEIRKAISGTQEEKPEVKKP